MSVVTPPPVPDEAADRRRADTLSPLPGELGIPHVVAPPPMSISKKGLIAVGLLCASLVAVTATGIQRLLPTGKKNAGEDSKQLHNKPTAAAAEPRKLEMPTLTSTTMAPTPTIRVPAIAPIEDDPSEPIGVRRSGSDSPPKPRGLASMSTEDAPVLLVSSRAVHPRAASATHPSPGPHAAQPNDPDQAARAPDPLATTTRNLQTYQRQLQGLLEDLTKTADVAAGSTSGGTSGMPAPSPMLGPTAATAAAHMSPTSLFGGQLQGTATAKVAAGQLGNRSLTLPKGTAFSCALKTRVISAASGLVGCQVQHNVFSDDGRVLLIERGSHLDGEYRIASVRPGMVRIPVLWTRIRTPLGVTVDIESPGTGKLGESGIDGHVDNRWAERIGAAMLLSLIDDSVKLAVQNQSADRQGDTLVLPATTNSTSKLAEKVLDSTINIPPLIYQNQGSLVGIYVARDVDFSAVYELAPVDRHPTHP